MKYKKYNGKKMNKKEITKDKKMTIRLTANELQSIKKCAEKYGYKSVSQFMIDKTTK